MGRRWRTTGKPVRVPESCSGGSVGHDGTQALYLQEWARELAGIPPSTIRQPSRRKHRDGVRGLFEDALQGSYQLTEGPQVLVRLVNGRLDCLLVGLRSRNAWQAW